MTVHFPLKTDTGYDSETSDTNNSRVFSIFVHFRVTISLANLSFVLKSSPLTPSVPLLVVAASLSAKARILQICLYWPL